MTPGPFRAAIDPVTAEVRVCLSNRYAALLEKLVAWQGVDPAERAGPLDTICRDATLMSQMAEDILHSWTDRITAADLIDASANDWDQIRVLIGEIVSTDSRSRVLPNLVRALQQAVMRRCMLDLQSGGLLDTIGRTGSGRRPLATVLVDHLTLLDARYSTTWHPVPPRVFEALRSSGRRQQIPATPVCANPEPASSRRSLL